MLSLITAECGDGPLAQVRAFVQVQVDHPSPYAVVEALALALEVPAAPPVFDAAPCTPCPFNPIPVVLLLVSLLLRPVGCRSFIGILGSFPINLPATIGPMINAMKMMNMKK